MNGQLDWGLIILLSLPVVVFLLPLIWWGLWGRSRAEAGSVADTKAKRHPEPAHPPVTRVQAVAESPDDLKRIEGIGPKIASVLNAAGIMTFAQLAATGVDELERIVREGGVRLAFPESWSEQAALAAEGRWEELGVLQESLKGGRRAS
ncbi:MAG: helix-hairpin-helix domain-containing protein [Anaerolineae bacterium]|jgi:predicted flap endonuclease-1-like 5' DNA nuclease